MYMHNDNTNKYFVKSDKVNLKRVDTWHYLYLSLEDKDSIFERLSTQVKQIKIVFKTKNDSEEKYNN